MRFAIMRFTTLVMMFSLAVMLTTTGCGKKKDETAEEPRGEPRAAETKAAAAGKTELKANLDGTLIGRVTLDGELPALQMISTIDKHADSATCLAGDESEKIDQKWIVGKDKGVANVVIFLKAPSGTYFPIRNEDKSRTDKVVLDQPHCAYIPHVTAAFPGYFEGKEYKRTGQVFAVKNSAPVNHNTKWSGDPIKTGTGNRTLKSGEELPIELKPESNPITLGCDIHSWMNAKVWAFDHPYFAVTKPDGTFEIKNIPTGAEVIVMAWHEGPGFFHGGNAGTKTKFNPGENKLDLTVKAK